MPTLRENQKIALMIVADARRRRSPEVTEYSALIYPAEVQLANDGFIKADHENGIRPTLKGWMTYLLLRMGGN